MSVTLEKTKARGRWRCLSCLSRGQYKPGVLLPPWRGVISLSIAYFCVYSAFESLQELQPSLHSENSLGYISLAIVYGISGVLAFFATVTIQNLGLKACLCWAIAMHIVYLGSNFSTTPAILLAASVAFSTGIALSSTCKSVYLSGATKSYIHLHGLKPDKTHRVGSMFGGVYYFFFRATHIFGNLLSSLILSDSSYDMSLAETNVCGAKVCSDYLTDWENSNSNNNSSSSSSSSSIVIVGPKKHTLYVLLFVFLAIEVVGFLVVLLVVPFFSMKDLNEQLASFGCVANGSNPGSPASPNKTRTRSVESRKGTFKADMLKSALIFKDGRFLLLMPSIFAQSTMLFIMYTGYTKAFISCAIGMQWVGYSMLFLGVSSAVSSLVANFLARYTGRIILFMMGMLIDIATLILMLLWQPDHNTTVAMLFVLPAVAGISMGIFQPQQIVLMASIFKEKTTSAYAGTSAIRSTAILVTQLTLSFACLYHQLLLSLLTYLLGLIAYLALEYGQRRQSHRLLPLKENVTSQDKGQVYGSISVVADVTSQDKGQFYGSISVVEDVTSQDKGQFYGSISVVEDVTSQDKDQFYGSVSVVEDVTSQDKDQFYGSVSVVEDVTSQDKDQFYGSVSVVEDVTSQDKGQFYGSIPVVANDQSNMLKTSN